MNDGREFIPWENPLDLLDRKKYADFLTSYLSSKEDSFVLNLNANWGMGKTFFLTHWRASLNKNHPTVYINAWETDFSDDPMLSVISALQEQLIPYLPRNKKAKESFSKALRSGGRFIKGIAPIVAKGLVNKAIGVDATGEVQDMFLIANDDVDDLAEKSISVLLSDHADREKSVKDFRAALSDITIKISGTGKLSSPTFIFIDELDRCRPTYAIELLEAVKHLFAIPGMVFVIATDSEQLQHSVCAIYGTNFSGDEYIRRFFDQEYRLPTPSYDLYCNSLAAGVNGKHKLVYRKFEPWSMNGISRAKPQEWDDMESLSVFLAFVSKHYQLPLRTVNQMVTRLEAILESADKEWDGPFLLLLLALNSKHNGFVRTLKVMCDRNEITSDKLPPDRLSSGGDTIRWYSVSNWHSDGHSDRNYTIAEMGIDYLQAIQRFLHTKKSGAYDLISESQDLTSNLLNQMAHFEHDQGKMTDITKYFEYVDIAGELS